MGSGVISPIRLEIPLDRRPSDSENSAFWRVGRRQPPAHPYELLRRRFLAYFGSKKVNQQQGRLPNWYAMLLHAWLFYQETATWEARRAELEVERRLRQKRVTRVDCGVSEDGRTD